jgi:hypothetical protein
MTGPIINRAVSRSGDVLRSVDGDDSILKRLAQHLESLLTELGQLVEEQHAAVGAGDYLELTFAHCNAESCLNIYLDDSC